MQYTDAFALFVKIFFLMTPPFVMTVFLSVTKDSTVQEKHALAIRVTISVAIASAILLFFGSYIFSVFGITLPAFRIGTGAVLFLSAIEMINGDPQKIKIDGSASTLAIVPMAIPITLGPASIGAIMVYGGDLTNVSDQLIGYVAILGASICVGILLWLSRFIEKALGKTGISIMAKLTGLILSAMSAQMIFDGAGYFMIKALQESNLFK
ncbi:MAG: MarC family protein [Burkholderiales bacterium]|nr:MarC family protein [Burkholderiales bacterium]